MSDLKTLLLVSTNPHNAVAFYRSVGELFKLRKHNYSNLDVAVTEKPSWHQLRYADAVFMERPYKDEHLNTITHARAQGLKVWSDYDDLLFEVPSDNPCYELYKKEQIRECIRDCIMSSDYVTFSTEFLKDKMGDKNNPNHIVINNGLAMPNDWVNRVTDPSPKEKVILWRGSNTHQRDLMAVSRPIVQAAQAHPEWKFVFMGWKPWFLMDYMPNAVYGGGHTIDDYFIELIKHDPDCIIVPLVDSAFNRAKSNIAGLEASWLTRSNVIAPSFQEWNIPGWFNYTDENNFGDILSNYMKAGYQIDRAHASIKYLAQHFDTFTDFSVINYQRMKILEAIVPGLKH